MLELIAGIAVAFVAIWAVLQPLLTVTGPPGEQSREEPGVELEDLEESASPKIQALLALKEIEFDRVLFYADEETTLVGQPLVKGAKVVGKINGVAAGPKLYPMQFRRRKDSQRRIGHRQKYIEVEITDIQKPS